MKGLRLGKARRKRVLQIYEGECVLASSNRFLQSLELDVLKMHNSVIVCFEINVIGLTTVTASCADKADTVFIVNASDRLSPREILQHVEDAEKEDRRSRERLAARHDLYFYCYSIKQAVEDLTVSNFGHVFLTSTHVAVPCALATTKTGCSGDRFFLAG